MIILQFFSNYSCITYLYLIKCPSMSLKNIASSYFWKPDKEVQVMAKCAVCGKGAHFGNNVSHSHRRSNRMFKSNIKSVRCKVNGGTKTQYVCARCLKSGKVERA